eukprot:jgi/Tetstr1/420412/TSEL_011527.t1
MSSPVADSMPAGRRHQRSFDGRRADMLRLALALPLLACLARGAAAARVEDRVLSLPGLRGELPSALYSGYLTTGEDSVHYMLAESERDPVADPLVLWLNGGPGASALIGFFQELGPAVLAADSSLLRNPYAWTSVANMLFLESPTGVGYSTCGAMRRGQNCAHSDSSTAALNVQALARFLEAFPEYAGRPFWLWGESYAGVYVPTLAEALLGAGLPLQLRGFAVGDPCTSEAYQHIGGQLHFNLNFALQRGFISAGLHATLSERCTKSAGAASGVAAADTAPPGCRRAWRAYWLATSDAAGIAGHDGTLGAAAFVDEYAAYAPSAHAYDAALVDYLSSPGVVDALHVGGANLSAWGRHLNYTKEYEACFYEEDSPASARPRFAESMLDVYRRLAGKVPRMLVFNGDTDPCLQFQGTEDAVASLGYPTTPGGDWRPWFIKPEAAPVELLAAKAPTWGRSLSAHPPPVVLGGYVTDYVGGLSFATVHGSGHLVPMARPQAALHLFAAVVAGAPLAPPLDESALEGATDGEFFGAAGHMRAWVDAAQSSTYAGRPSLARRLSTRTVETF